MKLTERIRNKIKSNENMSASAAYNIRILPGLSAFNKIMSKHPADAKMFLCPYAGTGDVYLASLYMKAFARNNGYDNYVVVVIGGANFKVAKLFEFDNIEKISQSDADCLVRLSMFLSKENDRIIIMHHRPPQMYCGILENMRNINHLNFADLFIENVFHVDPQLDKQLPNFDYDDPEIESIMQSNHLTPGKTVVLSPFVNTLPSLPWWVWVNIAAKLSELGYDVCTNVGSPSEFPVNGTKPLMFGYNISVPLLERCGYFVGIRSGFCDIVSSAMCKKIIVYQPYLFWGAGTNFDYFSLNEIGFCNDAIELEYEGVEFYDLIDRIIQNITDNGGQENQ